MFSRRRAQGVIGTRAVPNGCLTADLLKAIFPMEIGIVPILAPRDVDQGRLHSTRTLRADMSGQCHYITPGLDSETGLVTRPRGMGMAVDGTHSRRLKMVGVCVVFEDGPGSPSPQPSLPPRHHAIFNPDSKQRPRP